MVVNILYHTDYSSQASSLKIAIKENDEMNQLIKYLSNTNKCIFARMTGSGSCCYAAYEKQDFAIKAQKKIKENFPQYWSFAGKNDIT